VTLPARRQAIAEPLSEAARNARDQEWVRRVRVGDAAAFEAMFRAYKNDIGAFVESCVRSRAGAEEVVQDLFLRIWAQRELWEVPGPLRTYLFRAARNRAVSYLRHERVEVAFRDRTAGGGAEPMYVPSTDEVAVARVLRDDIEAAVDALPERCREVFRLARYHHLTYAEVAVVLELSVKTVEVHMGRALVALRKRLAGWRD
jgi:RNA polymerase sigma-70 factor (ECF subfamily)